jgi:hypothetical protein
MGAPRGTDADWPKQCEDCDRDMWPRRWDVPHADKHMGQGRCANCYQKQRRDGSLDIHRRRLHPCAEVAEEFTFLRSQGLPPDAIAARLGMKRESLERALQRAGRAA